MKRTMLHSNHDNQAGFTMTEILITLVILSFSMVALAALQIQAIRQVTTTKRANGATRLAQMVIGNYKQMTFSQLPNPLPEPGWERETVSGQPLTNVDTNGKGTGPYSVDRLIEALPGNRRLVTVRVTWLATSVGGESGQGTPYKTESVVLTTQKVP